MQNKISPMAITGRYYINLFKLSFFIIASVVLTSCIKKHTGLTNLKPGIMNVYANNVLAFFSNNSHISYYPNEYFRELIIKKTYIIGISAIVMLSVIIIILINRNLKRSQKSHKITSLQNEQLQLTLDELERVNKNHIRIMRVMAHDIINPLSGMTGVAATMMMEEELSEENEYMLRLIESTGLNTMQMINELLKTGLANEDEQMQKQGVDLRSLLFDSVELLQFRADEKQQQLLFEGDDLPVMVEVNQEKIWRVFNNLIVNAIKFSHDGGVIKVGIKLNKKHVLISVADSGIGIPDSDKNNVFEMFTSAKKTGTNGEQSFGLGLSISKKIIEKHQGKIWLESNNGAGTIFYIELPV